MDFYMQGGTLQIHIVQAKNLKEDDFFDKLDPICKVSWKESQTNQLKEYKTKALENAGKNPIWGNNPDQTNSFTINVKDFDQQLKFEIFDGLNLLGDKLLGQVTIDVDALCFNNGIYSDFSLYLQNIKAGTILLKTKYIDENLSQKDIQMEENQKILEKIKNQKQVLYQQIQVKDINSLIPLNLMTAYDEKSLKIKGPKEVDSHIVENVCTSFKTKFRCNFNPRDCLIALEFLNPICIRGYGIRTADSEPDYDPKSWEFLIDEVNIHTGQIIHQEKKISYVTLNQSNKIANRFQASRYQFEQAVWAQKVYLKINEVWDGKVLQICQLQILV